MKYYLKGATKIDNLNWIYNLSSPILLQTSKPITEENNAQGNNQMDLKMAKAMLGKQTNGKDKNSHQQQNQLISYDESKDSVMVYVRVFYSNQKWPLNI